MRQVIILSGISGSGKSTYAEKLLQHTRGVKVSADHYFMKGDTYTFDPSKLEEAHNDCFRRFIGFLIEGGSFLGADMIVVDNTNTTVWEISPYVLGATTFGYQPEIHTLWVREQDLVKAKTRSIHGVPLSSLSSQFYNLARRTLPKWWHNVNIEVTF
jgi:AAA domain